MPKRTLAQRCAILIGIISTLAIVNSEAAMNQKLQTSKPKKSTVSSAYPNYQFLRFNEDWSVLKYATPKEIKSDYWNHFKYIPISSNANSATWLSLGASARSRIESWNSFAFSKENNATFALSRLLVHADMHFGKEARVYVEGKSALSTNRSLPGGRRPLDVDTIALQQAFADLTLFSAHNSSVIIRAGRQEFSFGKQRLVSPLPWGNTLRTWDGGSVIVTTPGFTATAFVTNFVPVKKYRFNSTGNTNFDGIYITTKFDKKRGLDVYLYYIKRNKAVFFESVGREQRGTVGARTYGPFLNSAIFDYDIGGAYQFGRQAGNTISADMFYLLLSRKFSSLALTPKASLGFDYASGSNPASSKMGTFDQLFPLGHAYLGYIDIIGRQNIIDLHEGISISPIKKAVLGADYHYYWRANAHDALYNAGGSIVRAGNLSATSVVGSEIDTYFKYKFTRHLSGLAGYSHFFPGSFIRQSGPTKPINFYYLQLGYVI